MVRRFPSISNLLHPLTDCCSSFSPCSGRSPGGETTSTSQPQADLILLCRSPLRGPPDGQDNFDITISSNNGEFPYHFYCLLILIVFRAASSQGLLSLPSLPSRSGGVVPFIHSVILPSPFAISHLCPSRVPSPRRHSHSTCHPSPSPPLPKLPPLPLRPSENGREVRQEDGPASNSNSGWGGEEAPSSPEGAALVMYLHCHLACVVHIVRILLYSYP